MDLSIQNNGPPIIQVLFKRFSYPGKTGEKVRNLPVTLALLKEQGAHMRLCDTGQITGRVIFEIQLPLVGGNYAKDLRGVLIVLKEAEPDVFGIFSLFWSVLGRVNEQSMRSLKSMRKMILMVAVLVMPSMVQGKSRPSGRFRGANSAFV